FTAASVLEFSTLAKSADAAAEPVRVALAEAWVACPTRPAVCAVCNAPDRANRFCNVVFMIPPRSPPGPLLPPHVCPYRFPPGPLPAPFRPAASLPPAAPPIPRAQRWNPPICPGESAPWKLQLAHCADRDS